MLSSFVLKKLTAGCSKTKWSLIENGKSAAITTQTRSRLKYTVFS